MRSLKDKEYWQRQIKSGRLQQMRGELLVASFREGLDGVDSDTLAEVSLRIMEAAVTVAERVHGGRPQVGASGSGPSGLRAMLANLRGGAPVVHGSKEDLFSDMIVDLFALLHDPGHRWFDKATLDFGAVVGALVRKAQRSDDSASGRRRVTRRVVRQGRLVKVRPVERRVVPVDADELQRRSDASAAEGHASETAEREVAEEIVACARAVALDDVDVMIAVLVLARYTTAEIADRLKLEEENVRDRFRKLRRRLKRAQRAGAATLPGSPARSLMSGSERDATDLDEGGGAVPPLEAAE